MAAEYYRLPISRRRFVQGAGLAGLGLVGCGLPISLQPPVKVVRVGYLYAGARTTLQPLREEALRQGLRELGYVEGHNLVIEWRYAEGDPERLPMLVAELVRAEMDIAVAFGDQAIRALKQATNSLPIVMVISRDPIGSGFIASLARPGGNVTGLSAMRGPLAGKRLELLKDTVPAAARLAVLWNAGVADLDAVFRETEAAARTSGLQLLSLDVRGDGDLAAAFAGAIRERADALLVLADPLTTGHAERIVALAATNRLPTIYEFGEWVSAGGLMAYGPSQLAQFHRAAYYVDRILRGAKPADLPVEQPTTFELVINLRTAQALGLTIPPHVLLQATEIIQ